MHGHGRLVVIRSRKHLRSLGRDRGVLVDQLGHDAAEGFNTQGQRRHVEQQHIGTIASQHGALNRSAHGHGFVRVHVTTRFLAEEFLHLVNHLRHPGLATNQNHVIDVGHFEASITQRHAARLDRALDQLVNERFELGAGDLHGQVLRTGRIHGDVGQIDVGLLAARQFDLGLFCRFLQALQRHHVLLQIDARFFLEFVDDVVDQTLVEVFAAEESIAVGCQHFELLVAIDIGDFNDRDIEGTAAQVINDNLAIALLVLVHAKGERCSGRFVDDALHIQTGDTTGILGSLALTVVEVSRYGNHGFSDFFAEIVFGGLLHLAQHFGGDLRRRHFLVAHRNPSIAIVGLDDGEWHQVDVFLHFLVFKTTTNQALDRIQRVARVGHRLALGRCTHLDFAVFGISDDGRRSARAFSVFNDLGLAVFNYSHAGVGGAEVNTDNFCHFHFPFKYLRPKTGRLQ